MKQFYCPYCNEKLSHLEDSIIKMKGVLECETFSCEADVILPSTLGHYSAMTDEWITMRDGAKVDFHCTNPRCNRSFTAPYDDDLAEIKMIDEENHEFIVVFNRIYGQHSTFVVDYKKKKLENSFGEDKKRYLHDFDEPVNFFGE